MIAHTFQDAFCAQWVKTHLSDSTHDLIILRHIIPWQSIIDCLAPFYHADKGPCGKNCKKGLESVNSRYSIPSRLTRTA